MQIALVMFKMDGKRQDFPVDKARTVVGRKNRCDLRIPLSSVSREHCEIIVDDGGMTLRDLGSSNGTFVNDTRVQKKKLKAGDEITIGPVIFTVVIDGKPANIKPIQMVLDGQRNAPRDQEEAEQAEASGLGLVSRSQAGEEIIDLDSADDADEAQQAASMAMEDDAHDDAGDFAFADDDDEIEVLEEVSLDDVKREQVSSPVVVEDDEEEDDIPVQPPAMVAEEDKTIEIDEIEVEPPPRNSPAKPTAAADDGIIDLDAQEDEFSFVSEDEDEGIDFDNGDDEAIDDDDPIAHLERLARLQDEEEN